MQDFRGDDPGLQYSTCFDNTNDHDPMSNGQVEKKPFKHCTIKCNKPEGIEFLLKMTHPWTIIIAGCT